MNRSLYKNIAYIVLFLFLLGIAAGFWFWTEQIRVFEENLAIVENTEQQKHLDNFVFMLTLYSIIEIVLGLFSILMFIFSGVRQQNNLTDTVDISETHKNNEVTHKVEYNENFVEQVISILQDIIGKQEYNNEHLLEKLLWQICKELNISQGLIYIMREKENYKKLSAVANYALYLPEGRKMEYGMGEGLVGQVAKSEEFIVISQIPENYIRVSSGLGESSPHNLVLVPIKSEDADILGVLELASFKEITSKDRDVLEEVALLLAREIEKSEFIDTDTN